MEYKITQEDVDLMRPTKKRMDTALAKSWRAWKRLHGHRLGPKSALEFSEFHASRLNGIPCKSCDEQLGENHGYDCPEIQG